MATSAPKTAADIEGLEYDWLGCDAEGFLALFSTAGAGYAPAAFLYDPDAHQLAIDSILALPPTTEATHSPEIGAGLVNTWRLVAERGLYAYDCEATGGPYHLVAAPRVAARREELPETVVAVASRICCPVRFAAQAVITPEMLGA